MASKTLSKAEVEQIDISALLSTILYLDLDGCNGKSLNDLLNQKDIWKDNEPIRTILQDAIRNDESIGKIEIISESRASGYDDKLVIAAAFRAPESKNVYVAYRGTGDGKWVDNGDALSGKESQMQVEAQKYFDTVMQELDGEIEGDLIVTGHSKGGNSAQYVALSSPYGGMIDRVYSIDGQGFSPEFIEDNYAKNLDPDYYKSQCEKMYSINGENDYVHDLGIPVIPEDHVYFVRTPEANSPGGYHSIDYMMENGRLDWYDENGNVDMTIEQGPVGEFAKALSKELMKLDPEDRRDCAVAVMSLAERLLAYDGKTGGEYLVGTGEVKFATPEEFIGFIANGLPMLVDMLDTPEGKKLLEEVIKNMIAESYETDGIMGAIKTTILVLAGTAVGTALVETIGEKIVELAKIAEWCYDAWDKIQVVKKQIKEFVQNVCKATAEVVKKAIKWINKNLNPGMRYSNANPTIRVNTDTLRSCATRLRNVNKRVSSLDKRLDSLYWKVGFLDLWKLLCADLLTGYSYRVTRCANYLEDTAADFDAVEKNIKGKA